MLEVKHMSAEKKEAAVGTDEGCTVCVSNADPVYVYETQDWMVSPACSPDEHGSISPLLAEETFRYMTFLALEPSSSSSLPRSRTFTKVLTSDRVEQMTKAYNDIEVVTHLLAERDRDLELAARIGQSLLKRNHVLQERNESLEEQLTEMLDQVQQLQHELMKKDELLRMVSSASEESETDSSSSPSVSHAPSKHVVAHTLTLSTLEALQCKLQNLEEENHKLLVEASHLKKETITYEEKEQQLVSDCVKELRESNTQMVSLTEELSQKNEDLMKQQEEISQLLSQIVELQQRLKQLALEKEELRIHLQASKEAQRQLTAELNELADRNVECVGMLHESQEELKELRSKNTPSAGLRRHLSHSVYPMECLAAEIEGTMRRELSVEEEITFQDQRSSNKRVFQTVRSANVSIMRAAAGTPPIPGSGHCSVVMTSQPFHSNTHPTPEDTPHGTDNSACVGRPGSPGGSDLVSALHRLTLRRQNFLSERQYFKAERNRKLQESSDGAESEGGGSACSSPMGSVRSSFTNLSDFSMSSSCFKTFLPEKLQIVKPMEGSMTLHHWQQLAKPHLASVLDLHPGVVTKGFRPLPQDAVYHLNDLEEDEENDRPPWADNIKGQDRRKTGEEDKDDGITFDVHSSSTPDGRKERSDFTPINTLNLPPSVRASPVSLAAAVTFDTSVKSVAGSMSLPVSQPDANVTSTAPSIVNPGKCQSSTFSTYTFTTCRILHPSDVTQVTPSCASTPSSLRSVPSTPVTPCRLSLGDSFPPRRTTAPPAGLAKLLLEKGISAQKVSASSKLPQPLHLPGPCSTPPNSPCPSPVPFESTATVSDNFLASRPAELFLQDVYGVKPDLIERLRKLGLDKNIIQTDSDAAHQSSTLLPTGGGSLLVGLRRNQSLPAMVGQRSPSYPAPHPHPTSLALPIPPWGNLKPRPTRRHASLSQTPLLHEH
ncbi:trafficking kinesin-binding protein 2 isoform X3 [Tachysurus fulvidraco]|uniref:trafficking kinesin-binding protein 2 isoform X3 n=1 Tax=Tachysurus fulvidraco TaxID=1234273 RepID=UPI001FEEFA6B|nr:trafficking kinesin-binding protein 2 isoform X3 [Tachysurus fulvidraco]